MIADATILRLTTRLQEPTPLSVDEQEELRLTVAAAGRANLYFFAKAILGFKDFSPTLHREVCDFCQRPEPFKLIELPRGHLKTSAGTLALSLWRLTKDPNIRILLRSSTATNAYKWINLIAAHLLRNPVYAWLYPEIIPQDLSQVRWREDALEVRRTEKWPEATVEALGFGGTAVSNHYNLVIEDDPVNEDHLLNPMQMQKNIDEHRRSIGYALPLQVFENLLIGNRWAFDDVIGWVEEHEPYFVKYARAAIEHGVPIWPEGFSLKKLDQILARIGPVNFAAMYMNNPMHDSSKAFDRETFRYFDLVPPVPLRFYTAVDPAISQSQWADYTAIVTVAMDAEYNLYIVDARHGRWGVDEFIDQLFAVKRLYPGSVGIESVAFQKVLLYPIREAMRREQFTFHVLPLANFNRLKGIRIGALQEYFTNGSLWFRKGQEDLIRQATHFPSDRMHEDLLDALAYAVQMAHPASRTVPVDDNPFLLDNLLLELENRRRGSREIWSWHRTDRPERAAH